MLDLARILQTPGEILQTLKELEGCIKGFAHRIKIVRTTANNPEFVARSIKEHQERIDWHQAQINALLYDVEHADEIIDDMTQRIADLRSRINYIRRRHDIAKLMELAAKINEFQNLDGALSGERADSANTDDESDAYDFELDDADDTDDVREISRYADSDD